MRQTPRSTFPKPDAEIESIPDPKGRLAEIINKPLTPENINTYFDEALNATVELAERTRKTYEHIRRHPRLSTTQVEDRAFSYFNLQAIPEILTTIQKKREKLDEVNQWLESHTEILPEVIIPPEKKHPYVIPGAGSEKPDTINRLRTLLYVLRDENVDFNSLGVTKGLISDSSMRKISYAAVKIPAFNRLALVCDEEYNASYMFDLNAVEKKSGGTESLLRKTKEEINDFILQNQGSGTRFIYTTLWVQRVRDFLHNPLLYETREPAPDKKDIPRVSISELDPWRGFYTASDGKHYGGMRAIATKLRLGLAGWAIGTAVEATNLPSLNLRGIQGKELIGYSFEDIKEHLSTLLSLPNTTSSGTWKNFAEKDKKHYGTEKAIAERLGVEVKKIRRIIKENQITKIPIRLNNRERHAYSFEDINSHLKTFLDLPKVAEEGEWKGFWEKEGKHIGPTRTIANRLGVSAGMVNNFIKESKLQAVHIRDRSRKETDGYAYEDILSANERFLSLPRPIESGEWKGFVLHEGKHFSSPGLIATHLGMPNSKALPKRIVDAKLQSIQIRDLSGREQTAYAVEDTESLLKT